MSKKWILLTGMLSLGSYGTSQAHPLDSPDIVYIDGLPCNSFCQDYMVWSRGASSRRAAESAQQDRHSSAEPARRSATRAVRRKAIVHAAKSAPATPVIAVGRIVPAARETPPAGSIAVQTPEGLRPAPKQPRPPGQREWQSYIPPPKLLRLPSLDRYKSKCQQPWRLRNE